MRTASPSLRGGPFLRLLLGHGVSSLGSWVGTVAFIAAAYDLTGNPTAVGGVLVLRLAAPLVAAPVGGVLADRLDRRLVMSSANLAMAALIAAAPFVGLGGLLVIAFVTECLSMLFLPARDATVPDLVPEESLPTANGLILGCSYGVIPVAAALFSLLRIAGEHLPPSVLAAASTDALALPFFFNAAMSVAAASLFLRLPAAHAPDRLADATPSLFRGLGEAFREVGRSPVLRGLAAGVATAMFGGGALFAVGIAYVRGTLGAGDPGFGGLVALWGAGMALGVATVRALVRRGEGVVFQGAVATCGLVLVLMAVAPVLWLALAASLVFGAAFSVAVMLAITLVQRATSAALRGRILGAAHMLFRVGLAAGALGIGGLAAAVGPSAAGTGSLDGNQIALLVGGVLIVAGALAARAVRRAP